MKMIVNGVEHEVAAATLADALEELGYAGRVVATALNRQFVPLSSRVSTRLAEHDAIEIIVPMQGG